MSRVSLLIAGCSFILCLVGCTGAHKRTLAPWEQEPRTKEAWTAKHSPGPVRMWVDVHPAYKDAFAAHMKRLKALDSKYTGESSVYNPGLADELIAELYVDIGHPELNCRAQDYIISGTMEELVSWPKERLPDAARIRLRDGLKEYAKVGGGRCSPRTEAELGGMLDELALGDAATTRLSGELLDDAFIWTENVDGEIYRVPVYRICARHWGNSFWRRAYEMRSGQPVADTNAQRYRDVIRVLGDVAAGEDSNAVEFTNQIRAATEAALAPFNDQRVSDDLISRLIIAYDCLLLRRPLVSEPVSVFIDQQLVSLASDPARLKTDRHWLLWSDCVRTLDADRASANLLGLIQAKLDDESLPSAEKEAFERVAGLLPGVCPT